MVEGKLIGSKVKLPTDRTRPMELDFLGRHDDGIFVLELKVDRSAERNAFSELLGYSNYISEMFALSGPKDITNVLIAPLVAKISRHAFLYDLLISDRNIVLYQPNFETEEIGSLKLDIYIPSDAEFQHFSNELLSHDAMTCVVASFHELETPEWSGMMTSMVETVFTHNLGFRPTGMMRESYVANINSSFSYEAAGGSYCDNSVLKVNETFNWFKAWTFMERLGFRTDDGADDFQDEVEDKN